LSKVPYLESEYYIKRTQIKSKTFHILLTSFNFYVEEILSDKATTDSRGTRYRQAAKIFHGL